MRAHGPGYTKLSHPASANQPLYLGCPQFYLAVASWGWLPVHVTAFHIHNEDWIQPQSDWTRRLPGRVVAGMWSPPTRQCRRNYRPITRRFGCAWRSSSNWFSAFIATNRRRSQQIFKATQSQARLESVGFPEGFTQQQCRGKWDFCLRYIQPFFLAFHRCVLVPTLFVCSRGSYHVWY